MKIAILAPNFVEFDGGAVVVDLQAKELARQGNYVAIFTLAADMKPEEADLFIMGMPKSLFWQRVYRLLFPLDIAKTIHWLPQLKNFDLVITHYYPLTWLAYLAKKIYKVKHTFWFHGIEEPRLFPHLYERIYTWIHIFLTKMTVQNADRAVSVSKFAQKKLKQYTGLNSEVIYNQIDLTKFSKEIDGSKIRQRHNLGDAPIILNVGRLAPQKGGHLLIEAFKLIKGRIPQAKLMMVGDSTFGYHSKELKQMSDESVMFIGHVSRDEMPGYYAACDIYATCSLFENHNLPVEEAQACGKPVVAFDIEAFKEKVNGKGALVETGNIEKFAQACLDRIAQVRQESNQ